MRDKVQTKERKATQTKEAILASAVALFAQKGYVGTSMADLAEQLGLSKAAIYHHFENKEALFHALVDSLADDMEKLLEVHESASPHTFDRLNLLRGFAEVLNSHLDIMHLAPMHMVGAPADFTDRANKLMMRMQKLLVGKNPTDENALRARSAIVIIARLGFSQPAPFRSTAKGKAVDIDLLLKVASNALGI
ncbi:MAG TPA: helix-turn-helix domain-containing protein [Candidatus Paceibacterota bacterium]|nr:helix-turn-helix domain-containing protein [Candidatus Paceibacterota bacterium]